MSLALAFFIGVVSTGIMDLGALACDRLGIFRKMPQDALGKWILRPTGLRNLNPKIYQILGRVSHYAIGGVLALLLELAMDSLAIPKTSLFTYAVFWLLTCCLPWFWLFPSLGLGLFAGKADNQAMLLRMSSINHFSYALAVWIQFSIFLG